MSGVPPVPPPATQATTPPPPVTATVVSEPPPQVASLPAGAILEATVANLPARAAAELISALGNFTVKLPASIAANAVLKLQIAPPAPNGAVQFRVLAIDGRPLSAPLAGFPVEPPLAGPLPPVADPLAALAGRFAAATPGSPPGPPGAPPPVSAPAAGAAESLPPPQPGAGLLATIVFGTQQGLPNGTQLLVRLLSIAPPGPAAPGASPATPSSGVATTPLPSPAADPVEAALARLGATPLTELGAPQAPGFPGAAVVAGSTPLPGSPGAAGATPMNLSASGATPPASTPGPGSSSPASASLPALLPAQIPATVAPNSLGGRTLLQTPLGLLTLDAAPGFPAGARLLLETVGAPAPPAAAASSATAQAPAQATGWTALADTVAALQQSDPTVAQALVARLPDLGPQFGVNLAIWVSAAQSGDMRAWLGDRAVKALEKAGRADLISRLEADMSDMRAPVTLPASDGQWQALTLPLFFGSRVERIRMTLRRPRDGEEEEEARDEEGARFLVDVEMSRMGALQFDGLIKRKAKQFDLIVRSRVELPDQVQRDIGAIFARCLEGMGMTGAAVFKQAPAFVEPIPVHPAVRPGLTI